MRALRALLRTIPLLGIAWLLATPRGAAACDTGSCPATGLTTLSVIPGIRAVATGSSGSPLAPTLDLAVGIGTRF